MILKRGRSTNKTIQSMKCQVDFFRSETETLRRKIKLEVQKRKEAEALNESIMKDYENLEKYAKKLEAGYLKKAK